MKAAVVLLSGGLDSATAAAKARALKFDLYGLTLTYGQTHACEINAAKRLAKALGFVEHRILDLPLGQFGGSSLVGAAVQSTGTIPATYVPARNTVFLSIALGWAEVLNAEKIFIGVNAVDYSGYPDCRPEFIEAFNHLAQLATRKGVTEKSAPQVVAPLIHLSKAEIIREGMALGLDYSLTHSCYFPSNNGTACGVCDSCKIRLRGFAEAGLKDPIAYQTYVA